MAVEELLQTANKLTATELADLLQKREQENQTLRAIWRAARSRERAQRRVAATVDNKQGAA